MHEAAKEKAMGQAEASRTEEAEWLEKARLEGVAKANTLIEAASFRKLTTAAEARAAVSVKAAADATALAQAHASATAAAIAKAKSFEEQLATSLEAYEREIKRETTDANATHEAETKRTEQANEERRNTESAI